MKTFDQIREGYVSMAQQRAVWATRKDGGKGHPDNKRKKKKSKKEDVGEVKSADKKPEKYIGTDGKTKIRMVPVVREQDSDAVKAFLAKGGKIKKLPPAKAQGYHGRDDPGKDMHGVMDRPDTKRMGTRKKVKSMEARVINPRRMDAYRKFAKANKVDHDSVRMAHDNPNHPESKRMMKNKNFSNALRMYRGASEAKETDPPFDDAKKISTTPSKDQFGNIIKNRAKHLARQAAKKAGGDMGDKK